jgi:predicted phosphodiesterase
VKVALLSDIHANEVALSATLQAAQSEGAEQLVCCGDFVGYYHAPDAMLDLLDRWHWQGIRGNHEDMLERWLGGKDREAIHARYGSGIAIAARMPKSAYERLLSLPQRRDLEIDGRRVLLCHGSAWDPDHYVYPTALLEEPGSCWALWDTRSMEVTLQRTSFDTHVVADRARWIDPHLPYLADVLTRQ